MVSEKVLAIIPARGGSKGIPRKNLRKLGGVPLVGHTIRHAKEAKLVHRVVVSTEDPEISTVAHSEGAEVIIRSIELAADFSPSEDSMLHVLDKLKRQETYSPDLIVLLQCTSPIREPDDTDRAIETLLKQGADSLFSGCRSHAFLWRLEDGAFRSFSYDYNNRQPRQAMPIHIEENGSIYVTRPEILRKTGNRLGGKIAIYEMSRLNSFQVDDEQSWLLIEQLFLLRRRRLGMNALSELRLLVLDFDGVLTDNRVLVSQEGSESVWCHRGDGEGIRMLQENKLPVVVISREKNTVVEARCQKLGVKVYQGCANKLEVLHRTVAEFGLKLEQVGYVGNEIDDLSCMKSVGVSIAVADAADEVKSIAHLVTLAPGGFGAVREIVDWILGEKVKCHE